MTASKNKRGVTVSKVVTASLVGALSLGSVSLAVAPAVAVAQEGGASLQSANEFTDAKLTAAEDSKGGDVDVSQKSFSFVKGSGQYLVPTELTGTDGTVYDIDTTAKGDYALSYEWSNDGGRTWTAVKNLDNITLNAQDYRVTVTNKKTGASWTQGFKVTEASLKGAVAYEVDASDANDVSDTTFTYSAAAQNVGFQLNGKKLVAGTDYDVKFIKGNTAVDAAAVVDAGDYTAVLTGKGAYQGTQEVKFAVEKLDLSKAAVSMSDIDGSVAAEANPVHVSGVADADVAGLVETTLVSNPDGNASYTGTNGKYTVRVSVADNDAVKKNVTGDAEVSFYKVDALVPATDFTYGGTAFASGLKLNTSEGDSFRASKIKVKKSATENYKSSDLEVTYTDLTSGKTVDADALAKPGKYRVTVRVNAANDDFKQGGSATLDVTVERGTIDADKTVAFYKDGQIVYNHNGQAGVETYYDGTDVLDSITAVVKDSEGNELTEGTDYTLKVTQGNKEVDSITDAGTYTITVDAPGFDFGTSDNTLKVKVNKANLLGLAADYSDGDPIAWNGSAVTVPGVKKFVLKADGVTPKLDEDGKNVYETLSTDLYTVQSIKDEDGKTVKADAVTEAGTYTVNIKLTQDAYKNYSLGADSYTFQVKKYKSFDDVDPAMWYAKSIWKAATQYGGAGYINGYGNTNTFGPQTNITRADAVLVLYNMAGNKVGTDDFGYTEDKGYVTGFSDVDGHMYYAKGLAWAHKMGIANGFGDGTFGPEQPVTREQFATLLANYARMLGKYTPVENADQVLGTLSDPNSVTGWAKDTVAWAVQNKVMGNAGYIAGQSNIIRAEVATMALNYQPEGQFK